MSAWESDPWKNMGVKPNSTAKLQKQYQSDTSLCKYCGKRYKLIEMINHDICFDCYGKKYCLNCGEQFEPSELDEEYCNSCAQKKKICRECGEEFIPKKDYYHTCPKCIDRHKDPMEQITIEIPPEIHEEIMHDKYEYLKNKYILAFIDKIENEEKLIFLDNVTLESTISDTLTLNFFDVKEKFDGIFPSHYIKFAITDSLIQEVGENLTKEELSNYDVNKWEDIPPDLLEYKITDYGFYCLVKLVESINIVKREPCEILSIDLYDGDKFVRNEWEDCPIKYFFDLPPTKITESDIECIMAVFSKIIESDQDHANIYPWKIASEYFERYSNSDLASDQLIDLIIALESLLSGPDDQGEIGFRLKMRASLYLFHLENCRYNPKQVQQIIKRLYSLRSSIVHGNKGLEDPEEEKIKLFDEQINLDVAIQILREIIRNILLDAILNHSNQTKGEFIDEIDSIWYKSGDLKSRQIDYYVTYYRYSRGDYRPIVESRAIFESKPVIERSYEKNYLNLPETSDKRISEK